MPVIDYLKKEGTIKGTRYSDKIKRLILVHKKYMFSKEAAPPVFVIKSL